MFSILGLQISTTSGCALYFNGEIVFAVSEERFTKVKNETIFPHKSIESCIRFCKEKNIPLPSKAVVPSINMDFEYYILRRECTFTMDDYIKEVNEYWYPRLYENKNVQLIDLFKDRIENSKVLTNQQKIDLYKADDPKMLFRTIRANELKKYKFINSIEFINHEYSHSAYGFYSNRKEEDNTLVVTIDGFGDDSNASIWIWEKEKLVCKKKYINFNIGRIYRYITLLLGMKPNEHEYKVMGLAPYADEKYVDKALKFFENTWYFDSQDGEVKYHELPKDSYFYFREKLQGIRFDTIAGALQKYSENMITQLVDYWAKELNKSRVNLSGGVSLNIKANMHVSELDSVEDLFVAASGGDESLSIGAIFAYIDSSNKGKEIANIPTMYLGNRYDSSTIVKSIKNLIVNKGYKINYQANNKDVATLLSEGKIVGRFAGRMEFGARSLGNRAILANPSRKDVVKTINKKIKKRDFWMPFTPSVIDYKAKEYLINPKDIDFPFMTIACNTTEKAQNEIFGALHPSDYTARPQIVTQENNKEYWDLIDQFHQLTGIGALLNTSLNLSGLPICESPEDVINVFENSTIDAILLENILIERNC